MDQYHSTILVTLGLALRTWMDGWMDGWMDRYLIFDTKGKIYFESESEKISDFHQKINVKRIVQDV